MRKIILLFVCLIMLLSTACGSKTVASKSKDSNIPSGYTDCEEYFDKGFQDYTDFCKYYYVEDDTELFAESSSYQTLTEDDIDRLAGYFDNFSGWMALREDVCDKYDFDTTQITVGDYYYVITKEGCTIGNGNHKFGKYDSYTVYYYDSETHTLYYIHSNI